MFCILLLIKFTEDLHSNENCSYRSIIWCAMFILIHSHVCYVEYSHVTFTETPNNCAHTNDYNAHFIHVSFPLHNVSAHRTAY